MLAFAFFDLKNRATLIALLVIGAWHTAAEIVPVPAKLPFLQFLCNSAISFSVYASLFAYTHYVMHLNTIKSKEY